ncbi:hypothetical protein CROQUDRAFT_657375 [Cronartium quercuum f. sp. fusiforme G11]|uniref:Glycoside hydrolase family 5 domain-containing protein n=1 Tax=Cronartium quercuum f. sp. fusiforme G11 TaxID=708437 RepID=A0A9P6NI54_9BASI|nr:hypothetical protein CROQUDRAFT_657375 [Cronartium quercuum f. sp. fusiforme G11]
MFFLQLTIQIICLQVFLVNNAIAHFPGKVKHGVGIGGWLVSESWMNPTEWKQMGGEVCKDPSTCATTEFRLAQKLGQARANEVFKKHWQTWFDQTHVDRIKALQLDHVKIPLGWWIIEQLVQPPNEIYPQGGWTELKRGLNQLKEAGISVILDLHAVPGVGSANQYFAGNYTSEVHFYTDANYQRALTWTAVVTAMIHHDPDFQRVVGLLAVNEPEVDGSKTPGLEDYYSDFVTMVRVVEYASEVPCGTNLRPAFKRMAQSKNVVHALEAAIPLIPVYAAKATPVANVTELISQLKAYVEADDPHAASERKLVLDYVRPHFGEPQPKTACITTVAMQKAWQKKAPLASMAPHALGPRVYEDHVNFALGGSANATFDSYIETICRNKGLENAKLVGEVPFGRGQFSLATNFHATLHQIRAWGDAQKVVYRKDSFWTFWNFRVEDTLTELPFGKPVQWSYLKAVESGVLPTKPSHIYNPSICDPYL